MFCWIGWGILRRFFRFMPNLQKKYGVGSWAIVTGGANGIGKAFCFELAKQGMNVLILDKDDENM